MVASEHTKIISENEPGCKQSKLWDARNRLFLY